MGISIACLLIIEAVDVSQWDPKKKSLALNRGLAASMTSWAGSIKCIWEDFNFSRASAHRADLFCMSINIIATSVSHDNS